MLITRRIGHDPRLAFPDALRTLGTSDTGTGGPGGVLCYFPVVRGNPYQSLLYGGLDAAGLVPVPTYDVDTTAQLVTSLRGSDLDVVVHVHWLNVVMANAFDTAGAREKMKTYLDGVARLQESGARIAWTVHNILPHEERSQELEAELRREMVGMSERVHVMSPRTVELTAPYFEIPEEKLLPVPHPAFHGVYPSWLSREQARRELGISPDSVVLLMSGRVKPYKGLTELLDSFDVLSERDPGRYTLLVAGPPDHDEETERFRERLLTHPSALAALRKIPDDEMQLYLRASDVAVFPYRRMLNSGVLALCLAFGLPVVLRSDSGEVPRVDPSFGIVYDDDLTAALAETPRLCTPEARLAAAAAGETLRPDLVAGQYATAVREWLDS